MPERVLASSTRTDGLTAPARPRSRLTRRLRDGEAALAVIATVYLYWGVSLIAQPSRWEGTPAYYNLFRVLAPQAWGGLYITSALTGFVGIAIFTRGRKHREVCNIALALMIVLTLVWLVAFVIRYFTNPSTTPFTVGSSLMHLFMLGQASVLLGDPRVAPG